MKWIAVVYTFLLLVGCGGESAQNTGGSAGEAGSGGVGGTTVSSSSAGGTAGAGGVGGTLDCIEPTNYEPIDGATMVDVANKFGCGPVYPLEIEDGSFTRLVLTPLCAGKVNRFRFAARADSAPPKWRIGIAPLSATLDPAQVGCASLVKDRDTEVVDSVTSLDGTVQFDVYEYQTPFDVEYANGDRLIACIQNHVNPNGDGINSGVMMCGPQDNQGLIDEWQDNVAMGGAVHTMASYGPGYKGHWFAGFHYDNGGL
jgi:hypothetical protein